MGSTCPWLKRLKDRLTISTLVLGEGVTEQEISMTGTHWRKGVCEEISGAYEKTGTDGKFLYHKSKWNVSMESYVVHTNYDEYAILLTKKFSRRHGPTITAKLYGREPQLRESLLEEFREVALGVGIPADSIFTMADRGECVPGEQEPAPPPPLTPASWAMQKVLAWGWSRGISIMVHPWPVRPSSMAAAWATATTSSQRRSVCRPAELWRPAVSP